MLNVLIPTLKGGLEIAFLLALLTAYLDRAGRRGLIGSLKWGALLGLAASPGLAYGVESFLEREVVEGWGNLLAALSTLALILWLIRGSYLARRSSPGSGGHEWLATRFLILMAVLSLVAVKGLEVALLSARIFAESDGLLSTELITKAAGVLLSLSLAVLVGMTLRRVVSPVPPLGMAWVVILSLVILLTREATTVVHLMLVRGLLPLTDWLFNLIVPLINHYGSFYYGLFIAASALVLWAAWEQRCQRTPLNGLNPALRRKQRALSRRASLLTYTVGVMLALVVMVDGANAIYTNRPITLSPAIPVQAQNGAVTIPLAVVSDGKLYRFSYQTQGGTTIRFLVIHKGSGIYGVALDACEFCGVAGYRQDGSDVVCNKCAAHINIATIGLPGGCNPIPVDSQVAGEALLIPVEALQARAGSFSQ